MLLRLYEGSLPDRTRDVGCMLVRLRLQIKSKWNPFFVNITTSEILMWCKARFIKRERYTIHAKKCTEKEQKH